jgi:hypothetical protein
MLLAIANNLYCFSSLLMLAGLVCDALCDCDEHFCYTCHPLHHHYTKVHENRQQTHQKRQIQQPFQPVYTVSVGALMLQVA